MKILLLGATGQVGWELHRTLSVLGELTATTRNGSVGLALDTGDLGQLQATLDAVAPDVVVNATAYTAVDRAEDEPDLAMRLNAEVPALIGAWAAQHRALAVHYSTDYVFDGTKDGPYVESDAPNPVNAYGRSKLAGDRALLESGCDSLILRVSWVYSLRGRNFLLTIKRLMQERDELGIVDDQVGAPTWSRTIAQATSIALARLPGDPDARRELCGLYHLAPAGSTSWFGFATAVRDALGLDCALKPIPTSAYPTPARRPPNSRLDSSRFAAAFGLWLPGWDRDLQLCLPAD
jgi:dTDP-4-dehydrorhamnose reductase